MNGYLIIQKIIIILLFYNNLIYKNKNSKQNLLDTLFLVSFYYVNESNQHIRSVKWIKNYMEIIFLYAYLFEKWKILYCECLFFLYCQIVGVFLFIDISLFLKLALFIFKIEEYIFVNQKRKNIQLISI